MTQSYLSGNGATVLAEDFLYDALALIIRGTETGLFNDIMRSIAPVINMHDAYFPVTWSADYR